MKKHTARVLLCLALASSAILAGCGSATSKTANSGRLYIIGIETQPGDQAPPPPPPPPPAPPGP